MWRRKRAHRSHPTAQPTSPAEANGGPSCSGSGKAEGDNLRDLRLPSDIYLEMHRGHDVIKILWPAPGLSGSRAFAEGNHSRLASKSIICMSADRPLPVNSRNRCSTCTAIVRVSAGHIVARLSLATTSCRASRRGIVCAGAAGEPPLSLRLSSSACQRHSAMSTPEPLNPRDIATLERAVKRYQSLGFEASLGITHEAQGRAAIWYVDPRRRRSDTFQLDIEKYAGEFGAAAWIIQIARSNGFLMTMTNVGQVSSNILLFALSDAERVIGGEKLPERKIPPGGAGRSDQGQSQRTCVAGQDRSRAPRPPSRR